MLFNRRSIECLRLGSAQVLPAENSKNQRRLATERPNQTILPSRGSFGLIARSASLVVRWMRVRSAYVTLSAADEIARFWRTNLHARGGAKMESALVEWPNGLRLSPMKPMPDRQHYYANVSGLGNVAVSRHAQDRMDEHNISQAAFERALLTPIKEVEEGTEILWRERDGIRIVIVQRPVPFSGAKLVKTVMRVGAQAGARGHRG
jgi:hypothetical protein